MPQLTRTELRTQLAEQICALPHERLLQYGITRCGDVTGLDTIGLPVYTSCRPAGKVIAVSAGKGLSKLESKAGALIESMELWAAENPSGTGTVYCNYLMAREHLGSRCLPIGRFPLAKDSFLNPHTPISWDIMLDVFQDESLYVPSDLVWMAERIPQPFAHFQSTSNGVASGTSYKDALIQSIYELVERDGWATSEFVRTQTGRWPSLISPHDAPDPIQLCLDRISRSGTSAFLFDISSDLPIPVFSCILIPNSDPAPGMFSGYGCSLDACTALRRAITEAAQARACYISGGRDDLFRRRFLSMKYVEMKPMLNLYQSLPVARSFSAYPSRSFSDIDQEWDTLSSILHQHGITDLYCRVLYAMEEPSLTIVRCVCPSLAHAPWENWSPNDRCKEAVDKMIQLLK